MNAIRWITIALGLAALVLAAIFLPRHCAALSPGQPDARPTAAATGAPGAPSAARVDEEPTEEPTFDIVRVDRDGALVAAGRALPGALVRLLKDGEKIAEAEADRNGEWVIIDVTLPPGAAELKLAVTRADGSELIGGQSVVVAVPDDGRTPLIAIGREGGPTKILQSPFGEMGDAFGLHTVDYNQAGGVIFSGRATPGSTVRLLLNEREVGSATADAEGLWVIEDFGAIAPGIYDLQVEELDAQGRPIKVATWPFKREAPEALAAVTSALNSGGDASVVVQPGNSLWRIARRAYGSGFQYTVIYNANADQIDDPDLIYPGQIFEIPE